MHAKTLATVGVHKLDLAGVILQAAVHCSSVHFPLGSIVRMARWMPYLADAASLTAAVPQHWPNWGPRHQPSDLVSLQASKSPMGRAIKSPAPTFQ
jgi:hypothetical protein